MHVQIVNLASYFKKSNHTIKILTENVPLPKNIFKKSLHYPLRQNAQVIRNNWIFIYVLLSKEKFRIFFFACVFKQSLNVIAA